MIRVIKNSMLVLCMLACMTAGAQFKYKAALETVNKSGYYHITITPELSSYIKTDFSDLRIVDSDRQVPYVVKADEIVTYDSTFASLHIIENIVGDSGKSVVTIENRQKITLSSIALLIRNASVNRFVDITGSDDKQHWYSIAENGYLEKRNVADKDRYLQTIDFPASTYRYLRLIIYNGRSFPLNIISAGIYKAATRYARRYSFNPKSSFRQVDSSNNYSYVFIHDSPTFRKDFIWLISNQRGFFYRGARIMSDSKLLAGLTISSDSSVTAVPAFKAANWLIEIYNGDNPPLKISNILTGQEPKKIVAWLDSGKTYHLEMNDSLARQPVYDLENFKDSIPKNIDEIKYSDIQPIAAKALASPTTFFKQSWLWPVMIAVLAVLVLFTVRLTKEMGKKAA